jgi:hypothetical protein
MGRPGMSSADRGGTTMAPCHRARRVAAEPTGKNKELHSGFRIRRRGQTRILLRTLLQSYDHLGKNC